jgi:hypothetical protein
MGKIPKVTLMVQCKVNGKWRRLPAPVSINGRPKPVPGATYYLRYQRNCWRAVGLASRERFELNPERLPTHQGVRPCTCRARTPLRPR